MAEEQETTEAAVEPDKAEPAVELSPSSSPQDEGKSSLFAGLSMHVDDVTPKLSNASKQHVKANGQEATLPPAPMIVEEEEHVQESRQELTSSPVTDKLLGSLETSQPDESLPVSEPVVVTTVTDEEQASSVPSESAGAESSEEPTSTSAEEVEEEGVIVEPEESLPTEPATTQEVATAPAPGWFGGWFGGTKADSADELQEQTPGHAKVEKKEAEKEAEKQVTTVEEPGPVDASAAKEPQEDSKPAAKDTTSMEEAPASGEGHVTFESDTPVSEQAAPAASAAAAASPEAAEAPAPEESETIRKEMDPKERKALDEAFTHEKDAASKPSKPRPRGLGIVHEDTPIPDCDVALRLLRKFANKTRPKIISTYGGSKPRTIMGYLFGSKEDPTFTPYRDLMDIIYDEGEDRDLKEDSDRIESDASGVDMDRARQAIAAFVYLFSVWGHASSRFFEQKDTKSQQAFSELLSASFDAASLLVAHGCLDGVQVGLGDPPEYNRAVHMLAQSVFNSDLTIERNELAALKFLLSTGCRVTPDGDAMLRGSHLLQTIRIFYHIYLTTESSPNKTTARAALQQLVSSVFARLAKADEDEEFCPTPDKFPSENHRDAFLVMRSICKLSMRSLPDPSTGMHSHIGINTSGSNDMWDGNKDGLAKSDHSKFKSTEEQLQQQREQQQQHEQAHLIYTSAIHPALESKILALELLLYVLNNTKFSRGFIQRSGPQFHAGIRNYLCVSLLKNCTSDNTRVVELSLRIFVPLVRNFRTVLKTEIEAFVTNVFFVILDSKNSPVEHKCIVVRTFDEICSDPATLAEIFLNYDCDLSAVDLFHRIVNTLSRVSRSGMQEPKSSGLGFMGGSNAARMEKFRIENRELRLDAMRALRQVMASLHASIVEPMAREGAVSPPDLPIDEGAVEADEVAGEAPEAPGSPGKQSLVEIYGSKKKRRAEESEVVLRFNQKPSAGIAYAVKCGHVDGEDPVDVARYLLKNKDEFEKTQIGEYLGREAEYQNGFSLRVLHEYVRQMDFTDLQFDDAIRYYLSGFRLPGEAQKIDRIMEKFAERYTEQNPDVFPSADVAFILSFSIIMLNTDLHNPAIKEERRMTKEGFIRNNRGICDGQDLPEEYLMSIFERIRTNPISLKEDDEAREREGEKGKSTGLPAALSPVSFFSVHYDDVDRARETNFQKERDHIVRTTESLLKRRRHSHAKQHSVRALSGKSPRNARFVLSEDSGLRDEYVSPMFEAAWGPALAGFSTAMESANGTAGALIAIASDEELELAAENAAETIEVCLTGFRFAVGTAGLCRNETARDAYMLALSRFSQLGTGVLLEPRHVRCIQTLLSLAREDSELLGSSWEHVFKALSEINRFHQLFHLMARNDRVAADAAARRRQRMEEKERRRSERAAQRAAAEDGESVGELIVEDETQSEADDSLAESDLFSDDDMLNLEEDMDSKAIDEANARTVYEAVSEGLIEAIYERSSSLSAPAVKDFVLQLCIVSRNEIAVGNASAGADFTDLTQVSYRQQHVLLNNKSVTGADMAGDQFHHHQPNIYSLQKLVEVTHYNMLSRPRLIFAELWATVAGHLTYVALHPNPAIAMYAVDSFRQLSIQYLQRDELEVFEFQRRFLKPLETVMAKSEHVSTKELLLNCVDRIIHVFRTDPSAPSNDTVQRKGGLRSGWVPILTILGYGGRDANEGISRTSFQILSDEIKQCLEDKNNVGVLLAEHFLETVNTLFMFVSGQHEELSLLAIDQLVVLADFLGDDSFAQPQFKRRAAHSASPGAPSDDAGTKQELDLWWPILLGLSRSVGDIRLNVRSKGLDALVEIVNHHFFPPEKASAPDDYDDIVQTLQLIFRGILTPMLEFAEIGSEDSPSPPLPDDFERFLNLPPKTKKTEEVVEEGPHTGWLETTFDPFMDACFNMCFRSIRTFGDDALAEEIFAILNNCLLSDSGSLAVRGLRRLEDFITYPEPSDITDDTWATVSHMIKRCFSVRGLPPQPPSKPEPVLSNGNTGSPEQPLDAEAKEQQEKEEAQLKAQQEERQKEYEHRLKEYEHTVREFVAEETLLADRRYVGSNATMVVGVLLTSERFSESIDLRWRLFLITGLGQGIIEWERAAEILASQNIKPVPSASGPPDYRETAVYARKWMNRFVLQLASMKEVAQAQMKTDRYAVAQALVIDETKSLMSEFVKMEKAVAQYRPTELDESLHSRFLALLNELLTGLGHMDWEHLKEMDWISPILLGLGIQSKNADVRLTVQKLVERTSPMAQAPPPPPPPRPPTPEPTETSSAGASQDADPPAEASVEGAPVDAGTHQSPAPKPEGESKPAESTPKATESWNPLGGWFGGSPSSAIATETTTPETSGQAETDAAESAEEPLSETAPDSEEIPSTETTPDVEIPTTPAEETQESDEMDAPTVSDEPEVGPKGGDAPEDDSAPKQRFSFYEAQETEAQTAPNSQLMEATTPTTESDVVQIEEAEPEAEPVSDSEGEEKLIE